MMRAWGHSLVWGFEEGESVSKEVFGPQICLGGRAGALKGSDCRLAGRGSDCWSCSAV